MKFFRAVILLLTFLFAFSVTPLPIKATSVDPIPPFSLEGNPDEQYFFDDIFPLFRFVSPRSLEIYENRDLDRTYENLEICPGQGHDRRDKFCNNRGDGCEGEVDICYRGERAGQIAYTTQASGSCNLPYSPAEGSDELITGKCEYVQRPSIKSVVKGTDFSSGILTFPKIQSKSLAYGNFGTDNAITWGSSFLNSDSCEISFRQLLVVERAKQTRATLRATGEWPLGWVDWGYTTANGKTLLQISEELPGNISNRMLVIIEGVDDFYLNAGKLEAVSDYSKDKQFVCNEVSRALAQKNPPVWARDLSQAPMYPPSWRQGYIRPSICVWDLCCPGAFCPAEPIGVRRGLYFDDSISQAYHAALDTLLFSYPLEEGRKIFNQIAQVNPLIRFAGSSSPQAIPSVINARLGRELRGSCLEYVPWDSWSSFGLTMDYLDSSRSLDPGNSCPNYKIEGAPTKENAGAYNPSPLEALLNFLWGQPQDMVDPVTRHLITIPDAMSQLIQEIQQPTYDIYDTLPELNSVKEFNSKLSNTVENAADGLIGGQSSVPASHLRTLAHYACDDSMFSSQLDTSIQAYALGTRIGCDESSSAVPEGKCDGQLFKELLGNSRWQDTSPKAEDYFLKYTKDMLTPELMNTYAAAEKATGVPCEVLAGIHFIEASNNPDGSLVSGRKLGTPEPDAGGKVFKNLLETAIYAGEHLKGKVGGNIKDANTLITALSRYNGGGNSNCQLGYPYPIPYGGCPRAFEGEDDPYPTSYLDTKHDTMYLLYCADHTACVPQIFARPGSFTVALNVYNQITKNGYDNAGLPQKQPSPSPTTSSNPTGNQGAIGYFPKSCGPGTLSTALGCIPYTAASFVSTVFSFALGIGGAIALVVMLTATFRIMTAGSNADQLKKGKELFVAAVAGLLFLIFSVVILRFIAGDIIKLPGF